MESLVQRSVLAGGWSSCCPTENKMLLPPTPPHKLLSTAALSRARYNQNLSEVPDSVQPETAVDLTAELH